jgi:hypothetical protein
MADYSNSKIYKITNNVNNQIYIGSTIKTLKQRFNQHKYNYKRFLRGNGSNISSYKLFDKYGIENCAIELIQIYPCDSKKELEKLEGTYIKDYKVHSVNKIIAGRTDKQYKMDNADKVKEQNKQYRTDNVDKINEYQKQYYVDNFDKIHEKINCFCGGKYIYSSKSNHCKTKKHKKFLEQQTITNNNNCNITINNYN